MQMRLCCTLFTVLVLAGCNSTTRVTPPASGNTDSRTYRGTASVGDFLAVIIDQTLKL